jgi:flagellar hook-length control protein FliK
MELAVSLPADLAVLADPTARGAAPLLRPPDAAGASPLPGTPFELCLAALTAELPDGEVWPVPGKELPLLPLEAAADTDLPSGLDAAALAIFAPATMAELAVQARLGAGDEAAPLPSAGNPIPPPLPPALQVPTAAGEPVPADAPLPQGAAALDPLGALAPANEEAALAVDSPTPQDAPIPAGGKIAAPSRLEAFAAESRLQRPPEASATEARGPPPAAPEQLAALQPSSATAAAVEAADPQPIVRRVETPKALASAVTAAASASATDWLPAAASHSAAPAATAGAATASPVAAPQTPVDLRSPGWQEAFASRVQVLVDTKVGEARIKLNPPELGAIDVKISLVDDKTFVHLTTATAAARDELAQTLPRLRELFTVSGLELGGASVHNGHHRQQGEHGRGAAHAATHSAAFAPWSADPDAGLVSAPRRALGRIDVFA